MTGEYDIETPALRVKVYERGALVAEIPCESADDAADVVAQWEDVEGVKCELIDLAVRHDTFDILAPEPEDVVADDDYYR
ncbi:MAG TPA: hypothetical protein VEZ15_05110 [Acidimicrobiia bacterium]|nr:hypothetical protein [Acidimicrobiia bacterium]